MNRKQYIIYALSILGVSLLSLLVYLYSPVPSTPAENPPISEQPDNISGRTDTDSREVYAEDYSGADIGAKINAAYAALPADGGIINVSTKGTLNFSTTINQNVENKRALIKCQPGGATQLYWTGYGGTSTIINSGAGDVGSADHDQSYGVEGCYYHTFDGSTSTAIQLGGNRGAEGATVSDVKIKRFGRGLVVTDNTWDVSIKDSLFYYNERMYDFMATDNAGENIRFTNTTFADGYSTSTNCVNVGNNVASISFNQCSFDDCQVTVGTGVLYAGFNDCHWENPWHERGAYIYLDIANDSSNFTHVSVNGGTMMNGGSFSTTSPLYFIRTGGYLSVNNVSFYRNGSYTLSRCMVANGSYGDIIGTQLHAQNTPCTEWLNGVSPNATAGNSGDAGNSFIDYVSSKLGSWPYGQFYGSDNKYKTYGNSAPLMTIDVSNKRIGFGTSTMMSQYEFVNQSPNSTTTMMLGKYSQNKGTCQIQFTATGTPVYCTPAVPSPVCSFSAKCQ
jgi:hypothetical protein